MFTGNIMHMPGQELQEFTVLKPETRMTTNGRAGLVGEFKEVGTIEGVLVRLSEYQQRFSASRSGTRTNQVTHFVTHKIIADYVPEFAIKPGYVFERGGNRYYMLEQAYDVGGLGDWTIYYCENRTDV